MTANHTHRQSSGKRVSRTAVSPCMQVAHNLVSTRDVRIVTDLCMCAHRRAPVENAMSKVDVYIMPYVPPLPAKHQPTAGYLLADLPWSTLAFRPPETRAERGWTTTCGAYFINHASHSILVSQSLSFERPGSRDKGERFTTMQEVPTLVAPFTAIGATNEPPLMHKAQAETQGVRNGWSRETRGSCCEKVCSGV